MSEDTNTPAGARLRARFSRLRAPSASERLTGLITAAEYGRLFAAEAATWKEIMATEEAALDAELGKEDVAAINAFTSAGAGTGGERPKLRLVNADRAPAPYRDHYHLRLAGVDDGLMVSASEMDAEVREVRRLLMASGGAFPPDVLHNLHRYVYEGRILLAERHAHGAAKLVGCVAYEPMDLLCLQGTGGVLVKQRVNMIRLVSVSPHARRSHLATRLCLEAQLRGTARMLYDGGPHCIGTAGIILEANERALAWAERLPRRVRVVGSRSKVVANDPSLTALRDHAEAPRESGLAGAAYRIVVANRAQLFEAARYHLEGIEPRATATDAAASRIDYDREDPCSIAVHKVASAIDSCEPAMVKLLGLMGERDATVWGPPPTPAMSVPVRKLHQALRKARAGAAP